MPKTPFGSDILKQQNSVDGLDITTDTSYTDVLNITGSGFLVCVITSARTSNGSVEITIDGGTARSISVNTFGVAAFPAFSGLLRFKTSLLIRHKADAGGTARTNYWYSTD